MIWDKNEDGTDTFFSNAGPHLTPLDRINFNIFIARPVDNEVEAYRIYKENHNSDRANKDWNFLNVAWNKTLGKIYGKCKEYK